MNKLAIATAVSALLGATGAHALSVTTVDGTADSGAGLVSAFLGGSSGINVLSTSFAGTSTQSGTYSGFNLTSSDAGEPTLTLDNGILMTSGTAAISSSNTSTGFGTSNGLPGDADTDAALAGFPLFDGTNDANVLEFTFTVDAGITSISTDFVFGSEEYPEFPQFVDVFAFFVDGVNFALFPNGDPIVQQGTTQGFFNDNSNSSYGVEYDGLSDVLTLVGILDPSLTTHTIKIVVADDNDFILDSGVFLSSLTPGNQTGGGGINPPDPDAYIPVPAGLPLLLGGLGAMALVRRRKSAA